MANRSNESEYLQKKSGNEENNGKDDQNSMICNICLENPTNAVVSVLGHLFCWPCLKQWFRVDRPSKKCPVCRADIRKKIIKIYGCSGSAHHRNNEPPRPAETNSTGFFDQFSRTIGGMLLGLTSYFYFILLPPPAEIPVDHQLQRQDSITFRQRICLWIAGIFLIWILLA